MSSPYPTLSVTFTDRSMTITTGGVAQQAAAAKNRRFLFVQNPSTNSGSAWFSTTAAAAASSPSIELQPGQSYESAGIVSNGAVSVIHPTTGAKITCREA